jgi:hypothetical protein
LFIHNVFLKWDKCITGYCLALVITVLNSIFMFREKKFKYNIINQNDLFWPLLNCHFFHITFLWCWHFKEKELLKQTPDQMLSDDAEWQSVLNVLQIFIVVLNWYFVFFAEGQFREINHSLTTWIMQFDLINVKLKTLGFERL